VGKWFGEWFRSFQSDYRFDLEEARDLGNAVLIVASHRGRGRASGAEVGGRNTYLYWLRNGKIRRVEFYPTRAEALDAASRA
jgi:ketosteroid isomerase-like protein